MSASTTGAQWSLTAASSATDPGPPALALPWLCAPAAALPAFATLAAAPFSRAAPHHLLVPRLFAGASAAALGVYLVVILRWRAPPLARASGRGICAVLLAWGSLSWAGVAAAYALGKGAAGLCRAAGDEFLVASVFAALWLLALVGLLMGHRGSSARRARAHGDTAGTRQLVDDLGCAQREWEIEGLRSRTEAPSPAAILAHGPTSADAVLQLRVTIGGQPSEATRVKRAKPRETRGLRRRMEGGHRSGRYSAGARSIGRTRAAPEEAALWSCS